MKKLSLFLGGIMLAFPVCADHSWGPYHWARTTESFKLIVVNSTTADWNAYVTPALSDWNQSTKLQMVEEPGDTSTKTRRQCPAPSGRIRICNLAYGYNGWLGVAGIYIDTNGHIVAGYTKLNDSYFSSGFYNNHEWKQSVTCQELGHNVGLDHQDEDFNNSSLYSCMDYQNPPWRHPNAHDYEQLVTIYGHLDNYDSYDAGTSGGGGDGGGDGGGGCNAPPGKGCNKGEAGGGSPGDVGWGMSLGRRGQQEKFLRIEPDGTRVVTFVTWAMRR